MNYKLKASIENTQLKLQSIKSFLLLFHFIVQFLKLIRLGSKFLLKTQNLCVSLFSFNLLVFHEIVIKVEAKSEEILAEL